MQPETHPIEEIKPVVEARPHLKRNLYPTVRHILLVLIVLCALCFIIFLVHQNGKSIYDHGL